MIKIIKKKNEPQDRIIEMQEMKPLQVGLIVDQRYPEYENHYVMRTAYKYSFEVMDLSFSNSGGSWVNEPTIKVRLLDPGEKVVIEIYNEE